MGMMSFEQKVLFEYNRSIKRQITEKVSGHSQKKFNVTCIYKNFICRRIFYLQNFFFEILLFLEFLTIKAIFFLKLPYFN